MWERPAEREDCLPGPHTVPGGRATSATSAPAFGRRERPFLFGTSWPVAASRKLINDSLSFAGVQLGRLLPSARQAVGLQPASQLAVGPEHSPSCSNRPLEPVHRRRMAKGKPWALPSRAKAEGRPLAGLVRALRIKRARIAIIALSEMFYFLQSRRRPID